MNALTIRHTSEVVDNPDAPSLEGCVQGIARHVSPEGCQFVVSGKAPNVGCRFAFALSPDLQVSGRISWVLGERVGFAFDRQIPAWAVTLLAGRSAQVSVTKLVSQAS